MYKNADFIKRQREIHLRTTRGSKTHKGVETCNSRSMLVNILFSKYDIWKPSLRPQKNNLFNNNIARASRFFVHFFAATARRESA